MLGVGVIWRPEIFAEAYGIGLPDEGSKSALRSLIGGSEIGLGLVQMLHQRLGLDSRSLDMVAAFMIGSIAMVRLASMAAFAGWSRSGIIEFGLEAVCLAILIVALKR